MLNNAARLIGVSCLVVFALVLVPRASLAGQADKPKNEKTKNALKGKPCKGFNPKTDEIVETDKKGNCVLYHRGKGSSGVSFVYDQDGQLWSRVYGKDLQ